MCDKHNKDQVFSGIVSRTGKRYDDPWDQFIPQQKIYTPKRTKGFLVVKSIALAYRLKMFVKRFFTR